MATPLSAKAHDIGGLDVIRVLPNREKRMVGPFIFFDHMGPNTFAKGEGIDVRPHPHIGLATVTYLFEGSILHRDSLGNNLEIFPGDVNWMTAGRGIVHSERETLEVRSRSHPLNGLQCWLALPEVFAELEPSFSHVGKADLPHHIFEGTMMRLIAGEAYGLSSPIKTYSPMFYLDIVAPKGNSLERPDLNLSKRSEIALYVIEGSIDVSGSSFKAGDFILLDDNDLKIDAAEHCRFMMLGGEAFERIPYIDWNFVSFSKERIEKAKEDWRAGRFPEIPGDNQEFIPLK